MTALNSESSPSSAAAFLLPLTVPHPTLSLTLRAVLPSDASSIAHHADDERVTRYLPSHFPRPYTIHDADAFIALTYTRYHDAFPSLPPPPTLLTLPPAHLRHTLHQHSLSSLAIALDDACVGVVFIFPPPSPSSPLVLGYWLGAAHHRRGLMTAALRALIAWKEGEREGEREVEEARKGVGNGSVLPAGWQVVVQAENEANLAVVRRLGFGLSSQEEREEGARRVRLLTLDRPWGWAEPAVGTHTAAA